MTCGIYKITNNLNNKIYIGQSINIEKRWKQKYNYHLENAFKLYNKINFKFEIIETLERNSDLLNEREQYWLDFYQSYNSEFGYNLLKDSRNSLGYKHTSESLEKIRFNSTGENSPMAKLNWEIVNKIRKNYMENKEEFSYAKTARQYNVSNGLIRFIVKNLNWIDQNYVYIPREKKKIIYINKKKNLNIKINLFKNKKIKFYNKKNNDIKELNQELVKQIRNEYHNTNLTRKELSEKYGITISKITNIVMNKLYYDSNYVSKLSKKEYLNKIKGKLKYKPKRKNLELVNNIKNNVLILNKEQNLSQDKIAALFNVKRGLIRKILETERAQQEKNNDILEQL